MAFSTVVTERGELCSLPSEESVTKVLSSSRVYTVFNLIRSYVDFFFFGLLSRENLWLLFITASNVISSESCVWGTFDSVHRQLSTSLFAGLD